MAVSKSLGIKSNSLIYAWIRKHGSSSAAGVPRPGKGPKGRTVYPLALKQRAVAMVKTERKTCAEAAAALGVPADRVTKWTREGVKRGGKGDQLPAVVPEAVLVAVPTRQHRGPPSPFSSKDTRQYLLMMEQSTLAGIRDGRIKNLRDNPELVLALNALCASAAMED